MIPMAAYPTSPLALAAAFLAGMALARLPIWNRYAAWYRMLHLLKRRIALLEEEIEELAKRIENENNIKDN